MTMVVLEMANNVRAKLTTTTIEVKTLEVIPKVLRKGRATSIWAVSTVAATVAPTIEPKLWANIRSLT